MKWQLNKKTDDHPIGGMKSVGPILGSGTQLAITMVAFVLVGKYIDDKNSTAPLWTIIFSFLGIITGMYGFIKTIIHMNKKQTGKK
jgi:F0F1-type ATP synthase assembly protein I